MIRFASRILLILMFLSAFVLASSQPTFAADTGWVNPSLNSPDSYYGDGFEITPENAYSDGAGVATSINNHDPAAEGQNYYGSSFSFPSGAVIRGIEVRLDWWMNQVPGFANIDAGMTWDGGTSWTSSYLDSAVQTSEKTTVFGGPTDQWTPLHQWTVSDLTSTNFRVFVEAVYPVQDSQGTYEFYLDWVAVKVYYEIAPPRPLIDSQWTNTPPGIDGKWDPSGEWTIPQLHLVPNDGYPIEAYVYFTNDNSNLYALVDAVGDITNNAMDECLLVLGDGVHIEIIGAGGTTLSNEFSAAAGYDSTPNSANLHKLYEFSIPLSLINARPGDQVDFSSPMSGKHFASMPYDGSDGRDNVYPNGLTGNESIKNFWAILSLDQQQRTSSDPYHYVGGELFTANKSAILAPYLALIGLTGVASAAFAFKRRKL